MSKLEKLNQIQILRFGAVPNGEEGKFSKFIDMGMWLALAWCGEDGKYLFTQTSNGYERLVTASSSKIVISEAFLSLHIKANPVMEHLMQLAISNDDIEIKALKDRGGFLVDWGTAVNAYSPSIFCANEFLNEDLDFFLNIDNIELFYDGDKFSSIGDLPYFTSGYEAGIFGLIVS